ncbi:MAG: efflux RND transporter periplasmic adaptor subunit [Verrucomicrobiales bacterium]|nr:efflux RND transporter periplasmic adaptor subunit [Verrucomicrobiota bacterium JB025]
MSPGKKVLNLAFAPVVIGIAVAGTYLLINSKKPKPSREVRVAVPMVSVVETAPGNATPVVSTYGNVQSYYETRIAGQVAGKLVSVSAGFDPGLAVKAGEVLAKIEDADYKAAVAERQSELAAARQTLADEEARSRIAAEDWQASGRALDTAPDFTLRKPQLAAAQAAVSAAEQAVDKAMLDLARTEVRAPFDAIVQTRTASPGNVVAVGEELGTLVSRDKAEVRLPLTPDQVASLDLPVAFIGSGGQPITAVLRSPARPGVEWKAEIRRTEASIDSKNQVLYVIGEIADPFDNPEAFLPVGTFVTAELPGRVMKNVHTLPQTSLVNDAYVWVLGPDDGLLRQPVERLSSTAGEFIARIADPVAEYPLEVVSRPLASFRDGMQVRRTAGEEPGQSQSHGN